MIAMKRRVYLLDMNGTIRDDFFGVVAAVNDVLKEFGLRPLGIGRHRQVETPNYWDMYRSLGFDDSQKPVVDEMFRGYFYSRHADLVKAYPDALGTMQALKERGRLLGVVSNLPRDRIYAHLKEFGMGNIVDVVVGREDSEETKPSPQPLLMAFERLGLPPENGSYTGDQTIDVISAKAARTGSIAIAHRGSYHTERMLRLAGPDRVIRKLSGLLYYDKEQYAG